METVVAASEKVHPPAAWMTVKVCPAMVSVEDRTVALGLAVTDKPTVPLPDPAAPAVMVSQASGAVVVQAQDGPFVVTFTDAGPPDGGMVTPGAERLKMQVAAD